MKILDVSRNGLPTQISDEFVVPFADTRFPSRYKKLASYTLNWHTRLVMEATCRPTMFVTLTYDDDHYIERRLIDNDIRNSLKVDWQKFVKRLRRHLEYRHIDDCNFGAYAISERGDDGRLHFHALFFGFPFKTFPGRNSNGQRIDHIEFNEYTQAIDKAWGQGFTFYEGSCEQNIKYVTKYIHKRMISPDYISMKTRGLGLSYLTDKMKKYLHDNGMTKVTIRNKEYYLPRYLKQKIFDEMELKEVNLRIAEEKRRKIEANIPSGFDVNRHYVTYQSLEDFLHYVNDVFASKNRDYVIRHTPYSEILSSLDFSLFNYDIESDTLVATPIYSYVDWFYLRQRHREIQKYKTVYNKRL